MLKNIKLKTKLLFILGILLITIPVIFYTSEWFQLTFITPKLPAITLVRKNISPIITITIPAVNINLPVSETTIQNGMWGISENGVSHLNVSADPGQSGPDILYAHNTNDRFGPIRWLTPGKEVILQTADKKTRTYTIIATADVDPRQTSIFSSQKTETLYLYTCDGFADLKRFVVTALPKN